MTYPNDTIPQLVKELEGYDQVVGARTTEEGTVKALRVPAKWLIRKLASFLSGTKSPDLNSGFRAFRTDVGRLALGTLAALQGGLLLTQAKRDVGPLEAALDLAISQIRYHLS